MEENIKTDKPSSEENDLEVEMALAGVAQWTEQLPVNRKVPGSIPSQGTCPGCRPGPQLGACERQPVDVSLAHRCFSPLLSPSLPLSLKK